MANPLTDNIPALVLRTHVAANKLACAMFPDDARAVRDAAADLSRLSRALAERDAEIAIDNQLLTDRQRILDACPCPVHGPCVPHVLHRLAAHDAALARAEADPSRIAGAIISVHGSASRYGGAYGEILADDGEYYLYSSAECYRDGTEPVVGLRVSFARDTVIGSKVARNISRHTSK